VSAGISVIRSRAAKFNLAPRTQRRRAHAEQVSLSLSALFLSGAATQ